MPVSRGRKAKHKTPAAPMRVSLVRQSQPEKKPHWLGRSAGVAVAIIGTAAAIVTFWPRMTVELTGPSDNSNPLSVSFVIANTGYIPLENLNIGIGLCHLDFGKLILKSERIKDGAECRGYNSSEFVKPTWKNHRLGMDEKMTIRVQDLFNDPARTFSGGDITITIKYQPWIIPIASERQVRFVAAKDAEGKFQWAAQPID
ncbi:hypothetical protein SAMN05519104_7498 [Rhizobiales bacterium GAS188]|nr:hypothetical protein SAMN05519104_7498 [Rhizobiales bacterium GAS188]